MQQGQYDFPTSIHFGWGVRDKLPELLQGCERPIVVTDSGVMELDWFEELVGLLRDFQVATFSGVEGNPTLSQVKKGLEIAKSHNADVVVAIGGGAATDVAKAVALMLHHPGDLFDYADGQRLVDGKMPKLIAIPTTAGTGSEVGRSAVISCDETHVKKVIFSPRLLPSEVLADPELTMSLPATITAATGIDALTHLVEAFLAKGVHPICDGIALEGLRMVSESLVTAVGAESEGFPNTHEHRLARSQMLNASMMGAIAFQKGLGVAHSCAHALSAVCDLHHGLANGIILPYAMRFNAEAVPDKFVRMAQAVDVGTGHPDHFVRWLQWLNTDIGIPKSLAAVGVERDNLDALVRYACEDRCHQLNPRKVEKKDFEGLFSEAIG